MSDNQQVDQKLSQYLRPATYPVALRLLEAGQELPPPLQKLRGRAGAVPVCQGISLARRYGWQVLLGPGDMSCPLGSLALGFHAPSEEYLCGEAEVPNWVLTQEARAKIAANLPKLEHGKYDWLLAAPLARAAFEPQVILVYGNPAQMMRLAQSTAYRTGEPVVSQTLGAVGCGTYITKALLTGQCQMVVCGAGDRIFALTQDHEMVFAIPAGMVDQVLTGLEETHRHGMRYPIPSYLRFAAELPGSYQAMLRDQAGAED